jgi:hypothetical protein
MRAKARARARSRRRNDAADLVVEYLSVLEWIEFENLSQRQPWYRHHEYVYPISRLLSIDLGSTAHNFVVTSASLFSPSKRNMLANVIYACSRSHLNRWPSLASSHSLFLVQNVHVSAYRMPLWPSLAYIVLKLHVEGGLVHTWSSAMYYRFTVSVTRKFPHKRLATYVPLLIML